MKAFAFTRFGHIGWYELWNATYCVLIDQRLKFFRARYRSLSRSLTHFVWYYGTVAITVETMFLFASLMIRRCVYYVLARHPSETFIIVVVNRCVRFLICFAPQVIWIFLLARVRAYWFIFGRIKYFIFHMTLFVYDFNSIHHVNKINERCWIFFSSLFDGMSQLCCSRQVQA